VCHQRRRVLEDLCAAVEVALQERADVRLPVRRQLVARIKRRAARDALVRMHELHVTSQHDVVFEQLLALGHVAAHKLLRLLVVRLDVHLQRAPMLVKIATLWTLEHLVVLVAANDNKLIWVCTIR
jgi:hypothetical protein